MADPPQFLGTPSLEGVVSGDPNPLFLVVSGALDSQSTLKARELDDGHQEDSLAGRKEDAENIRQPQVGPGPAAVVSASAVEDNAPSAKPSRLALDPHKVTAKVHDQVVWVPAPEWNQDIEPQIHQIRKHGRLARIPFGRSLHGRNFMSAFG